MGETQILTINPNKSTMRRTRKTQRKTTIRNPTTGTKEGAEAVTEKAARAREEQGQEDCMNHQPGSLEQKLEEMMTPTEATRQKILSGNEGTTTNQMTQRQDRQKKN